MTQLGDHFREIAAAQADLDAVDDQLAQAIGLIEAALRERVSTRISVESGCSRFAAIAFGKHNGAWHLLLYFDKSDAQPLLAQARELRAAVLAGGYVERLINAAASSIRAQVADRKAASDGVASILHLLTKDSL